MDSLPLASSPLKLAMIIAGLALGVLDVKESGEKLDAAMRERTARAIGAEMVIADPFFVAKAWRDRALACTVNVWCYEAPAAPHLTRSTGRIPGVTLDAARCNDAFGRSLNPGVDSLPRLGALPSQSYRDCMMSVAPPMDASTTPTTSSPNAWYMRVGPVVALRLAIFPVFQAGWALFRRGWTARVVFALSILAALALAIPTSQKANSLPGALIGGVIAFLATSILLSFGFNLLLRAGNAVAGYWGVLVAIAGGIYFTLELVGKVRELMHATGIGKR